jgi:RHS repeat-associated protein
VIAYEVFHPWGTVAVELRSIDCPERRYRYTGIERDEETGLQRHGVRSYAPWLGRWTSADPAGLVDGSNRYGYGPGNPTGGRDPGGKIWQTREDPAENAIENAGQAIETQQHLPHAVVRAAADRLIAEHRARAASQAAAARSDNPRTEARIYSDNRTESQRVDSQQTSREFFALSPVGQNAVSGRMSRPGNTTSLREAVRDASFYEEVQPIAANIITILGGAAPGLAARRARQSANAQESTGNRPPQSRIPNASLRNIRWPVGGRYQIGWVEGRSNEPLMGPNPDMRATTRAVFESTRTIRDGTQRSWTLSITPGTAGTQIPWRLTAKEMHALTLIHNIEFALVYRRNPLSRNGRGGTYWLFSGTNAAVNPPSGGDWIQIMHTHPGPPGVVGPSPEDVQFLTQAQQRGRLQWSSRVVEFDGVVYTYSATPGRPRPRGGINRP